MSTPGRGGGMLRRLSGARGHQSKARVETPGGPREHGESGPRTRETEVTGWRGFRRRHGLAVIGVLNFLVFFVVWQLVQTYTPIVDTQWVPA
ncbi:MAG: hypothetical protein ACRDP6_12485, partial [Actinoallomurus sp.]